MKIADKRKPKPSRESIPTPSRQESSQPTNPLVFISHDSRDAELAEAFSKLLSGISAGILKSFRSSDKKGGQGIEFGVEWYPEVMTKIDSASDVVCLLTPLSLERPWILYEAGVAKGKMNIPVFGVALGVSLAKASTGPFAQFQNCGDDSESLTKLVTQLMCRIPGAEPDKDTIKMQVEAFKGRATEIQKSTSTAASQNKSDAEPEESVAKLFEEVKVMFRDLPARLEKRMEPPMRRKRRVDSDLIFRMADRFGSLHDGGIPMLIMVSNFKDELPWLYELGLEAYRNLNHGVRTAQSEMSVRRLRWACDSILHEPAFGEIVQDRMTVVSVIELKGYLDRLVSLQNSSATSKKKSPDAPEAK